MKAIRFLLLIGSIALWTGPVFAHASLIESDPADGSLLSEPPEFLALRFNEPVAPLVLRLVSADGASVALDRYRLDGTTVIVEAPTIGSGSHALSWRVVSEDGHPVGGSILFSVGAPSAGGVLEPAETGDRRVRTSIWLTRVLIYIALFVGIGGMSFGAFIAPLPRPAKLACAAALASGLPAALLSVGLQGLDALDEPLASVLRSDVWQVGFGTSYGATAFIAVGAMAAALVGLTTRATILIRLLALAALIGSGAALAASGHASAADPQLLMRPAVFVHVLGIALWTGALLPLGLVLYERRSDAAAALSRFSRMIPFVITPLAAGGILLAMVQIANPGALLTTAYGRLLLAKMALLLGLFTLAAINRWRLTKQVEAGQPRARRLLVRSIAGEIVLSLAILTVAAGWRFTPPPRSLDIAAAPPAYVHIHADRAMADLTITPGRVGPVSALIVLMIVAVDEPKEVMLVLSNAAAGIEPIRRSAAPSDGRIWRVDDLIIPAAGRWSVRIDILISDFEQVRLEGDIDIGG
jgi:copper transport protein